VTKGFVNKKEFLEAYYRLGTVKDVRKYFALTEQAYANLVNAYRINRSYFAWLRRIHKLYIKGYSEVEIFLALYDYQDCDQITTGQVREIIRKIKEAREEELNAS